RAVHARVLIVESGCGRARVGSVELVEADELDERRELIDRNHGKLPRRIERESAPMCAANVGRHRYGSLKTGRRERAFVPQRANLRETRVAIGGRRAPHAIENKALWAEWWKHGIERLRRRCAFPEDGARWYRTLLDRENRLAGLAVEDEELARLRCLQYHVDAAAVAHDGDERRRRRVVVVPKVVM